MSHKNKKGSIQVISRAASIMRALGMSSNGISLGQLSARCDLPRSTVQRIVTSLVAEGLALHLGGNQGFTIGPEIQALASSCKINVWRSIHPHLSALSHETGETVDLAVLQGGAMLFVDQVPGHHRLRAVSEPGERFSALLTANGKACLSLFSDEQLRQEFNVEDDFLQEIIEVRRTSLAWDFDEHTQGISAIGSAFFGFDGQYYAVSIPVPSQRFKKIKDKLAPALLHCIKEIKEASIDK
ncbi:IclR family transcriptional regulator [SAR92 clade bacterium H246]